MMTTEKQGKLKYSEENKSWYVTLENNSIHKLYPNEEILDIDLKLSEYYVPCSVNLKDGSLTFIESFLNLDDCFEYEVIIYIPWRKKVQKNEFDVPF